MGWVVLPYPFVERHLLSEGRPYHACCTQADYYNEGDDYDLGAFLHILNHKTLFTKINAALQILLPAGRRPKPMLR